MKKKYHHLANGTFRNPEGSKVIDMNFNWSFKVFNQEKKKLDMNIPNEHVISKDTVIKSLKENENSDYIFWIGHATFLSPLNTSSFFPLTLLGFIVVPIAFALLLCAGLI